MAMTTRDHYILAQALYVASREMAKEKWPELSNIEDMKRLLDEYFPSFKAVFESQERNRAEAIAASDKETAE
jgi:hypothetical protein